MKEQLTKYGFLVGKYGWLEFEKNGWLFQYSDEGYMWVFAPKGGDDEGICLHKLTYEKIIKLIDFITNYE